MRSNVMLFLLMCALLTLFTSGSTPDDFPVLKGPYLGQKPPSMTPKIFAPGIISTGHNERCGAFTPDGNEFYYVITGAPYMVTMFMVNKNGQWTKPEVAPFSGRYGGEFTISPDGNTIVFSSNMPINGFGIPQDDYYSWKVERTKSGWGEPEYFNPQINLETSFAGYPALSKSGNLYFYSDRKNGKGRDDIWMSKIIDGRYSEPVNLGDSINTDHDEVDAFAAADESYLIFSKRDMESGRLDLYISFHRQNGSWSKAINMGEKINSSASDYCPYVTGDGKYFFFTSSRRTHKSFSERPITYKEKLKILNNPGNGNTDIYWVDAKIIEKLKPKEFK